MEIVSEHGRQLTKILALCDSEILTNQLSRCQGSELCSIAATAHVCIDRKLQQKASLPQTLGGALYYGLPLSKPCPLPGTMELVVAKQLMPVISGTSNDIDGRTQATINMGKNVPL